jgi:hypothetical protein
MALKNKPTVTCHVNHPRTPKLWSIAHENRHNTQKRRVVVYGFKKALTITCLLYLTRTLKLWAIPHKVAIKHLNDKFLDKAKKVSNCHEPLKSFQNPKTVGELTKTSIKLVNDKFF